MLGVISGPGTWLWTGPTHCLPSGVPQARPKWDVRNRPDYRRKTRSERAQGMRVAVGPGVLGKGTFEASSRAGEG